MTSRTSQRPTLLYLVPANLAALEQKGVLNMICERDEKGFFSRVITVHPITPSSRTMDLNDVHRVIDIGLPPWLSFCERSKFFRYLFSPFFLPYILGRLFQIVREEEVSLIRATTPYWMGLFAWLLHRRTGLPWCVSIHADYDKRFMLDGRRGAPTILGSRALAKKLESFIFRRAQLVMPIRETLGELAVRDGARKESIRIIPHGVDMSVYRETARTDVRKLFGIDPGTTILSFFGRLSRENYVYDIVELARRLAAIREDFVIVMAGGGSEEDAIRTIVAEENLGEALKLVGFQPKDRVRDLQLESSVSLCLMGGFSLIEACAAENAVLSYDVEWHRELVISGETGFLVSEHDVDSLVEKAVWLLNHPAETQAMATAARALAFDRHELDRTREIKKNCYRELLERR